MPHQCAACGRVFADGSKEMLSGCPDCGGNKFQFIPQDNSAETRSADSPESPPSENSSSVESPASSEDKLADRSSNQSPTASEDEPSNSDSAADSETHPATTGTTEGAQQDTATESATGVKEDSAQASARSDVIDPNELPRSSDSSGSTGPDTNSTVEEPDLSDLRDELNTQFESIKIVNPGEYELNLMELYDRQEYIISLQENGRYVIDMPSNSGIDDN